MSQSSSYSYTERKRIRKSFGSRDSVVEIPYLLQMQKDAYTAFCRPMCRPRSALLRGCRPPSRQHSPSFRTTVLSK